jgi:hypothetical protein
VLTGIHGHQKKTLAFFVLGIVLSGSAVLQRVAETLAERGLSEAKMTSIERRLARFIANSRVVVPLIWKRFLAQVLTPFRGQHLYFVLDNTPFRDDLTMVYLGLLVHSRPGQNSRFSCRPGGRGSKKQCNCPGPLGTCQRS